MISYEPLWRTMAERGVTTYTLIARYGVNPRTINHLKHDRSVTMYTLEKICRILDCQAESVVVFKPDKEDEA